MTQIFGKTPYSGVEPVSGERPVLVILLESYDGDDARFNTYYGVTQSGELHEMIFEVSRDDGAINATRGFEKLAAPFAAIYPPAVSRSPHPHELTLVYATGSDRCVYQTFYDRHAGHDGIKHPWQPWTRLPNGIQVDSAPCALNTPDGSLALVFVTATDGQVYQSIFARGAGQAWAPWQSLHFPRVAGGPTAMNSTDGKRCLVFATGTMRQIYLSTYVRTPGSHWAQMVLPSGPNFTGTPACYASADGTLESVLAVGADGIVYQSMSNPQSGGGWSAWKPLPNNKNIRGGLSVLDAYNQNSLSVVAVDTGGNLVRCRFIRGSTHSWTQWDAVPAPTSLAGGWTGACQITTPATAASRDTYRNAFFGAGRSLRNYFWEASQGRFTIREAGVVGWLQPSDALGMPEKVDIKSYDFVHNSDRFGISLEQKSAWVVKAAELIGGFDYSAWAKPGSGKVTLDDLAIVWIYAGGPSGRVRGIDPSVVPVPSLSDGVSQSYGLPRSGPDPAIRAHAEELSHAILGIDDLYDSGGTINPDTEPLQLAITGSGGDSPHPSPWDKLKLGWAQYRVPTASGTYSLSAVENTNQILILETKDRSDEYFILENRHPPGSFESSFSGRGLAVWHIVEKYDANQDHWGRKTIRLLHCRPAAPGTVGETFLWDGNVPNRAYNLTDTSSPANLNWLNGDFSGLSISSISGAGPTMTFNVSVPGS